MPSITLKNVPEELYAAIRESAKRNRRSISNEILFHMERLLARRPQDVEEILERARRLRERTAGYNLTNEEIDAAKKEGRP